MRLEKMDLNLFVVFDAIYRERSVTKASIFLNLTQPAISNALSRLRQTFDDPLFVRSPDGMSPTPVADSIVADVREALALMGRCVGSNIKFDPATSEKVFHLGMNNLAEALLLPRLHAAVRECSSKITITSFYLEREAAVEDLKAGLLDLLLDAPYLNAKELGHQLLADLPYVVVMRPGHPLAKPELPLEDYLAAEHLHVSSRRKGRGQMDIALHKLGYRRQVGLRVQNYLVASKLVAETDLLWTAPKVLADTLPLHSVPLPFVTDPLEWHLYWNRNADNDPANQWMRRIIDTTVKQVLAP